MAFITRPTEEQRAQEAQQRQAEQAAQQAAEHAHWEAQYITPPATAQVPMWEYKVIFFGVGSERAHVERALNIMGSQGWELVTMDVERNQRIIGAPAQTTLVLKRQSGGTS